MRHPGTGNFSFLQHRAVALTLQIGYNVNSVATVYRMVYVVVFVLRKDFFQQ